MITLFRRIPLAPSLPPGASSSKNYAQGIDGAPNHEPGDFQNFYRWIRPGESRSSAVFDLGVDGLGALCSEPLSQSVLALPGSVHIHILLLTHDFKFRLLWFG